jgi:hypothetical protein
MPSGPWPSRLPSWSVSARRRSDDITGRANRENIPLTDPGVVAAIATENQKSDQEIAAAKQATAGKEMGDFQKTQNDKTKLQIESAKTVYQNLKQQAGDLFDQMVFHTKSWGEFAKGVFKTAILTPIKDIFSSQVSAFFTRALTGEKVSFGEVGNGQGAIGKAGGILGRLGMGQPRFGEQTKPVSRLDQPGHLGDVQHINGAVPVVIRNMPSQASQTHVDLQQIKTISIGSIGASSGPLGASPVETSTSTSTASDSRLITDPSQFGSTEVAAGVREGMGSVPSTLTRMFVGSLPRSMNADRSSDMKHVGSAIANSFGSLILSGGKGIQQIRPQESARGIAESTFIPESVPTSYGISPNGFPTMGEVSELGTPSGIFSGERQPLRCTDCSAVCRPGSFGCSTAGLGQSKPWAGSGHGWHCWA